MELNFERIIRLKKIRIEKSELSEEESLISNPLLADKSLVSEIYKIFTEILGERDCAPRIESVNQRKKFIFIILYLFSPSKLAGGKIIHGIREEMQRALNIHSNSTISDNCDNVVFEYQNYPDFSRDIEYIYTEILNRLKFKGLING